MSTWKVTKKGTIHSPGGWEAAPCDPVGDWLLDKAHVHTVWGAPVLQAIYVVAATRANAITRAVMLAKRQGVGI